MLIKLIAVLQEPVEYNCNQGFRNEDTFSHAPFNSYHGILKIRKCKMNITQKLYLLIE